VNGASTAYELMLVSSLTAPSRAKYPDLDTSKHFAKIPSQEFSDMFISALLIASLKLGKFIVVL